MLDLLKIIGDFALSVDDAIQVPRTQIDVGDWTSQGYPYFSGTGVYRCEVDVASDYIGTGRVFLEADCGEDVLEVSINGGKSLIAPWHPYRLDVTEHLREGSNRVEIKVTNTLMNVLEGERQASGLFAAPRLIHEHRYELSADDES